MASIQDVLNNLARDYAIAWSSGDADAVAGFFTTDGQISINRGEPRQGHAAIAETVREYFAEFPELELRCDMLRWAGPHAIFVWTLEGQHARTGNSVVTRGWEDWELDASHKIRSSQLWFDTEGYQRQIDG